MAEEREEEERTEETDQKHVAITLSASASVLYSEF